MRSWIVAYCLVLVALGGCATSDPARRFAELRDAGRFAASAADTSRQLADAREVLALPAPERQVRREQADAALAGWRTFEGAAYTQFEQRYRAWAHVCDNYDAGQMGVGLGNGIVSLRQAVEIDPSYVAAWSDLGRLCLTVGDLASARRYLEHARQVARAADAAGDPVDRKVLVQLLRQLAWTLRDLALGEEGLAAVDEGLALRRGDQELTLIRGLLLADLGRYEDAVRVAVKMAPLSYPQYDWMHVGLRRQTSGYANNWIVAQALLVQGDVDLARAKLGDLELYAYRGRLPFAEHYWRDAGLIAELAGDARAPLYYATGMLTGYYSGFYPQGGETVDSCVLDLPRPGMPVFTSFGRRFQVGGSPFSFVAMQIQMMTEGVFAAVRQAAAGRALQMLEILERRGIRVDVCRALRGRIYYAGEDYAEAEADLAAAHAAFAARGEVDPTTSTLLGLLRLRDERPAAAETLFAEAVAREPDSAVAWRSLGVAHSRLGHAAQAAGAMDRALALDGRSVAGLYNRGLLHLQQGEHRAAVAVLDRALRLEPENREVQRLLQMAAAGLRAEDGEMAAAAPAPDWDAMMAEWEEEIDAAFALPDSLQGQAAAMGERVARLEQAYAAGQAPHLRAALALAYIDLGRLRDVQLLLGPGWGEDLSPDEEVMLLYADRQLGESTRAAEVVRELLAGGPGEGNVYAWVLAARAMRTSVDRAPLLATPSPQQRFEQITALGGGTFVRLQTDRPGFVRSLDLYRQYADDPLLRDSVWGMGDTSGGPAPGAFLGK